MSYQVLARKWRPRDFESLVGQEHVVRALRHALDSDRLHHAYLFTGTRGVGKTTLARILAKCLNCETGVTSRPCGRCGACLEIDGGRFVDLLEVDAATNTRVDEMRQLLDTAQYAPTRGRYKVYVIDEVHMLSTSAFNAMLKTLEEPPEHLKFILATTDPQKIPVTVLSRCMQFSLKLVARSAIAAHLENLLKAEQIDYEPEALSLIGRAAGGSMRDALSLLDQGIAHGAGRVTADGVRDMLGAIDETHILRLMEAVAREDARGVAELADEMQMRSLSFDSALADMASLWLRVALVQEVPEALDSDLSERERIVALAANLDPEMVQLYYQIAVQGREDLPLAPDAYSGFVMTMLRMLAFRPDGSDDGARAANAPPRTAERSQAGPRAMPAPPATGAWHELVAKLPVTGAARELARNSERRGSSEDMFDLVVPKSMAHLAGKSYIDKLKAALDQYLGRSIGVKVVVGETTGASVAARETSERGARQAQAERAVQGDRFVQELVNLFDAKVVDSTVKAKPQDS